MHKYLKITQPWSNSIKLKKKIKITSEFPNPLFRFFQLLYYFKAKNVHENIDLSHSRKISN